MHGLARTTLRLLVSLLFLFAFPSASFAQPTPADQQAAADKLKALNLAGQNPGDLNLNENITRAELVTIIVRAFGQEENSKLLEGAPSFTDVSSHWASGYIGAAKSLLERHGGAFEPPGGMFEPDSQLTPAEAVEFLMKFLGVPPDPAKSWPSNYLDAAVEAGLITGDDLASFLPSANDPTNRGLVFYLLDSSFRNFGTTEGKSFYQSYVDRTPPVVTVNAFPATTDLDEVTLSGTTTDANALSVADVAVTILADGTWSATLPLQVGQNAIAVRATDVAGNLGIPATPVVIHRLPQYGPPTIELPLDGSTVPSTNLAIRGRAASADGMVEVYVDGGSIGTFPIADDGTWSVARTLASGAHTVRASIQTALGATLQSPLVSFTIDAATLAVTISSPASGSAFAYPPAHFSGTATPLSTVTLELDGTAAGSTTADASGAWTVAGDEGLGSGAHTLTATASASGSTSGVATSSFTVLNARPQAFIDYPYQRGIVTEPSFTIVTSGIPGTTMTLSVDGVFAGRKIVAGDGSATFALAAPLADGSHFATAIATDANGVTSPACTNLFMVDTQPATNVRVLWPEEGDHVSQFGTIRGIAPPGTTIEITIPGMTEAPFGPLLATPDPMTNVFEAYLVSGKPSGPYTMSVRDLSGAVPGTITRTFVVDAAAPQWPAGAALTVEATATTLHVAWPAATDNLGVDSYTLTVGDVDYTIDGAATSFTVTGLTPSTTYSLWLIALDRAGLGSLGPLAEVSTLAVEKTLPTPGDPTVVLEGGGDDCSLRSLVWTSGGATPLPNGVLLPVGVVDVLAGDCTTAGTLVLKVTLPEPMPEGSSWWKFGPTPDNASPHWYKVEATFNGNDVLIPITDGSFGDDDLTINGVISDPGGPAAPVADVWTGLTPLTLSASAGSPVSYVATIGNDGPDTALDVALAHTLPAGFALVSAVSTKGTCSGTSSVTCAIGSLALGESAWITFNVIPAGIGTTSVTVAHTSGVSDPGAANNSGTFDLEVVANASTTTVSTAPNPSTPGQMVTLTATVAGDGVATPTGNVTFSANGMSVGSAPLNASGIASMSTTTIPLGTNSIVASYPGDGSNSASTSPVHTHVVAAAVTTTVVSTAPNPSDPGQMVTLTATVTGASPTGTVTFSANGATLGSAALNGAGVATMSTTTIPNGANAIVASYGGDSANAPSESAPHTHLVGAPVVTTTVVTTTPNPSEPGATVTITATVTGASPTGTVTFSANGGTIGSAPLDGNGTATMTTTLLPVGTSAIVATYSGDVANAASTSAAASHVVAAAPDIVAGVPTLDPLALLALAMALSAVAFFTLRR